jgi:hypothetical protein
MQVVARAQEHRTRSGIRQAPRRLHRGIACAFRPEDGRHHEDGGLHLRQLARFGHAVSRRPDPEHNFLLQIRGSKEIHLFNGRDRSILSDEELESYYGGAHRNLKYCEAIEDKAMIFNLQPGFGLHFPVTYPHWVKNGNEVSVSFSVTFFSRELEKRGAVHNVNAWLRRRGWKPTPIEKSPWRDSIKYLGYRVGRRIGRLLGKREKPAEKKY